MLDQIPYPELFAKEHTFVNDGFSTFETLFDSQKSIELLHTAQQTRDLNDIFLSEEEFDHQRSFSRTGPRPGRNLAEKLDTEFIFGSEKFSFIMENLLGPKYRIFDYKFVCGVPTSCLPEWIKLKVKDKLVNNLGMYIKPKYRDITYFHGIDFHQDIIDYPYRKADFVTAYIYLDEVNNMQAPLHILPRSHLLGCTEFPHEIKQTGRLYSYGDRLGNKLECDCVVLTGGAGDMSVWHSAILHGTQPQIDDESRVSLRVLIERNGDSVPGTWLHKANSKITGDFSLSKTRSDIGQNGLPIKVGNILNKKI